jgi:hypothetical protein
MSEQLNLSLADAAHQDVISGPSKKSKPLKRKCRRGHPEIHDEVKKPRSFYLPRPLIDAFRLTAQRREVTPSELLETAIRTIDCSILHDPITGNKRRLQRQVSTSYALTKTAIGILTDLQRERQLSSCNAVALRVMSHVIKPSDMA